MLTAIGLLTDFFVIGPLVCWLLGLFNPIGYIGYRPWSAEVKEARAREAQLLRRRR